MKFLHTADWQIGMKASTLGSSAARVREERLAAAKRVVDAARNHAVDFILIAGDTFEDNGVDRILIQKIADTLTSFGGPSFIIPGNHDPLVPGSVWEHPAWKSAVNVRVLCEDSPVELPGGVLYPCPIHEKHSGRNPAAWIPSDPTGSIRIGLAHGTVEGVCQDEPDYPIPRGAAEQAGLDYLAMGHWHSSAIYPSAGAPHMAYSGTHETTKFGERDSGNALIVEISNVGAPPLITRIQTGRLEWVTLENDVQDPGDLTRVRAQIEGISNAPNTLLELILDGVFAPTDYIELENINNILASRFVWGRVDATNLKLSPQDDTWINSLPAGVIRVAATRLRNSTDAPPEVTARALMDLFLIAGGMSS